MDILICILEEPKAGIFRLAATEFTTRHLVQFKPARSLLSLTSQGPG